MSVSKDLVDVIKASNKKETKAYDTQATVTRIDGTTVWVHFPGGVDETPVKRTINAKEGDVVQVRVSGGSAWLLGNASSPPTDDTTALLATEYAKTANDAANSAVEAAKTAGEAASDAMSSAEEAKGKAKEAERSAEEAGAAATTAGEAANTALTQLSVVEDVVGTLNWISEHGTYNLTSDTEIVPKKVYFTRAGSGTSEDPYIYTPVIEPKASELGTYYELVIDDAVSTYIAMHLALTSEGLFVMSDKTKWKVLIANDGVYIIDDKNHKVAKYKDVITLGVDDGSQSILVEDYHSIRMFDKENAALFANPDTVNEAVPYFWISDLRDASGSVSRKDVFVGDGENRTFLLSALAEGNVDAQYGGAIYHGISTYNVGGMYSEVRINSVYPAPGENEKVTFIYNSVSSHNKAYTFGTRSSTTGVGCHSFVRGCDNEASGFISYAGGKGNTASGLLSQAEGDSCIASARAAHAEGFACEAAGTLSHAEGANTHAYGEAAHSEGAYTIARGEHAHTTGEETVAYCKNSSVMGYRTRSCGRNRLVIGMYNDDEYINPTAKTVKDEIGEYAFIIGNGTEPTDRSNAFAVKWDGVPYCRNPNNDYGSIFNLIYPVGSIYMSVNSVSPATLFGGTWERIQDRFLLAAGSSYAAGSTGGEATHKLTVTEMPAHTHIQNAHSHTHEYKGDASASLSGSNPSGTGSVMRRKDPTDKTGLSTSATTATNQNTGGGGAHNNMPPYLTVYMWRRTA